MTKPDITIQTKVGEVLEYYPELEDVLLSMSPTFAKLKNPILRKTVAKVASLKQVAEVGNLDLSLLITTLRRAAGLALSTDEDASTDRLSREKPAWVEHDSIIDEFDACPIINRGGSPMQDVLSKANSLSTGHILRLMTPFVPAPVIDILKSKGYRCWCCRNGEVIETYITK